MRIQNLYYKLGGEKGGFLQTKWSGYIQKKTVKRNRKLLQDKGICALDAMSAACKEAGVSFGMEFGTLLGAYRNQGFIPYDDDMDLTMWAEDCSRDFENVLLKYGFYKKRAFYFVTVDSNGKRTRKLTEIALDYDGLQVDIFFSFRKTEITRSIFVYCPPVVNEKMTAREFVLPIGLSPRLVTVRNKQYPAFADPHKTLSLIYGEDFMIPRKNASATKSIQSNVIIHDMFVAYGEGFMLE